MASVFREFICYTRSRKEKAKKSLACRRQGKQLTFEETSKGVKKWQETQSLPRLVQQRQLRL